MIFKKVEVHSHITSRVTMELGESLLLNPRKFAAWRGQLYDKIKHHAWLKFTESVLKQRDAVKSAFLRTFHMSVTVSLQ